MTQRQWLKIGWLIILICLPDRAAADSTNLPDANAILAQVDEIRAPRDSCEFIAVVRTFKDKKLTGMQKHLVTVGADPRKTLVRTLEPPNWRGRMLLAVGDLLWVFFPRTASPVRISAQQRLAGQVSNGDLARIVYSVDYQAVKLSLEHDLIKLDLTAKTSGATYHRVSLWVQPKTYHPLRAEFYGKSGKLLKKARYSAWKSVLGRKRPTRLEIRNPLRPSELSTIDYQRLSMKKVDEVIFEPSYLRHLRQ